MNGVASGILRIFESVVEERDRAMRKFGVQSHPDGTRDTPMNRSIRDAQRATVDVQAREGKSNWFDILMEEVLEVSCEEDLEKLDAELCQVQQVCTVWREHIQRRQSGEVNPVAVSAGGDAQGGYITSDQLNAQSVTWDVPGTLEKEMRELAGTFTGPATEALASLAAGFWPGRPWLLDNLRAQQIRCDSGRLPDLERLVRWVQGLPREWWVQNFVAENPTMNEVADLMVTAHREATARHDAAVRDALNHPLPGNPVVRREGDQ